MDAFFFPEKKNDDSMFVTLKLERFRGFCDKNSAEPPTVITTYEISFQVADHFVWLEKTSR